MLWTLTWVQICGVFNQLFAIQNKELSHTLSQPCVALFYIHFFNTQFVTICPFLFNCVFFPQITDSVFKKISLVFCLVYKFFLEYSLYLSVSCSFSFWICKLFSTALHQRSPAFLSDEIWWDEYLNCWISWRDQHRKNKFILSLYWCSTVLEIKISKSNQQGKDL